MAKSTALVDLVLQLGTQNLEAGSLQAGYGVLTGNTCGGALTEGSLIIAGGTFGCAQDRVLSWTNIIGLGM
jgi:hypothetical protein